MAGYKLQQLSQFLLNENLCASENFDSVMTNVELIPTSKNKGNGLVIARLEYDAELFIERFHGAPETLFAQVAIWLGEFDPERFQAALPAPNVQIDALDFDRADLEISVRFAEDIELVLDENGDIAFNGERWSIAPVTIDTAKEVAVGDSQRRGPDGHS